jgi:NTP-dependent ternary system trypsin peptidase co-occuring protein
VVAGRAIPVRVGAIELLVETMPLAGSEPTSRIDAAVDRVGGVFTRAQAAIVEVATSTVDTIEKAAVRAARPDQVEVEFGLKFSAKGDVIVAGAAGEATLKVKLVYRRNADEPGGSGDEGESQAS